MKCEDLKARFRINPSSKVKGSNRGFTSMEIHNYRLRREENIDESRSHLNEELISLNGKRMAEAYNDLIKKSPFYKKEKVWDRNVRGFEVELRMGMNKESEEALKVPDDLDLDKWKEVNIEWLKKTFGEQNIISAVLHLDEVTPHIHAVIVPLDENGRLNAKKIIGGPQGMREKMEDYGDLMNKEFGFRKPTPHRVAKSIDINTFNSELAKEASKELPEPNEDETITEYFERANKTYRQAGMIALKDKMRLDDENSLLKKELADRNDLLADREFLLMELEKICGKTEKDHRKAKDKIQSFNEFVVGVANFPDDKETSEIIQKFQDMRDFGRQHISNLSMEDEEIEQTVDEMEL